MASKHENILQIAPDKLVEREGWNVRLAGDPDNIAHIERLAMSIGQIGVQEPLTAYLETQPRDEADPTQGVDEFYVITNGHCRLAAVKLAIAGGAPIKTVPVRLEPKTANEADRTFSMISRNSGKNLSMLEFGTVCKRLFAFGWSEADIADKSGYGPQHIRNCVSLAGAGEGVTKLVETGQVAASLAVQAIAAEGPEQAAETLKEAVAEAEAQNAAKAPKKGKAKPAKATMKHVGKVKAKNSVTLAKPLAKKAAKVTAPKLDSMVTDAKVIDMMRHGTAIRIFDEQLAAERRIAILLQLLEGFNKIDTAAAQLIERLKMIFERAVFAHDVTDGTTTVILATDAWQTACKLLDVKQPETEGA